MPFELHFPTKWTVLSLPMHTIYTTQHFRKPPLFVDGQEAVSVFGGWLSQINCVKHCNNSAAKPIHGLNACRLANAQVLINEIT
jgi:hypothetical protein